MPYATDDEVDFAKLAGYKVERNTHRGHCFTKANRVVWGVCLDEEALRFGWQTADLVRGRYCNHEKFPNLKEALCRKLYPAPNS